MKVFDPELASPRSEAQASELPRRRMQLRVILGQIGRPGYRVMRTPMVQCETPQL